MDDASLIKRSELEKLSDEELVELDKHMSDLDKGATTDEFQQNSERVYDVLQKRKADLKLTASEEKVIADGKPDIGYTGKNGEEMGVEDALRLYDVIVRSTDDMDRVRKYEGEFGSKRKSISWLPADKQPKVPNSERIAAMDGFLSSVREYKDWEKAVAKKAKLEGK